MSGYLRALGAALLTAGVVIAVVATVLLLRDEVYYKAADGLARHPEHMLYKMEYLEALGGHLAYALVGIAAILAGVVGGSVLLGLGAILRRLDRVGERSSA